VIPALAVIVTVLVILFAFTESASAQEFDTGDSAVTYDFSGRIKSFAKAIASAEGYGLPNAIPTLANNPGDLVIPGWQGAKLGSEGISVLDADSLGDPLPPNGGWYRLLRQLQFIVDGTSRVYSLDMTIADMAAKWTATEPAAWASNVAFYLGVMPDTDLRSLLI
jgi:hypothetical protein